MSDEIQQRFGPEAEVRAGEVRAAEGQDLTIEGYAAVFNQSTDLGAFREDIREGAFDEVLDNDVRLLVNHDGVPLARTTNGTLALSTDQTGLRYVATLSDTQAGRDLYKMVKRGDISQSSFAFTIKEQEWTEDRSHRSVTKVGMLLDVSPVTYPAYSQASVTARNHAAAAAEQVETTSDTENQIEAKDAGLKRAKTENSDSPNLHTEIKGKMNINDLKGQRAAYYEEFVAIGEHCNTEGRSMTEAEQERADRLNEMIADLDAKIRHKKREQDMVARLAGATSVGSSEAKEIRSMNHKFSLSRAIQMATGKGLEGVEAEWAQEAQREMRSMGLQPQGTVGIPTTAFRAGAADDFQATPTGDGSGFVSTDVPFSVAALREPTFLQSLGVQTIQASGNLKFPRVANPALATEPGGEVTASTGAGLELDEITMQPRRVSTQTTYSKQLILQGGRDVDNLISNDIRQEMAEYIDREGFKEILGSSEVNDLSTAGTGTGDRTTFDAALAIEMEKQVIASKGSLQGSYYVMSPGAYKIAKTLPLVSGVSALFEGGRFNGYEARATAHLADVAVTAEAGSGQVIFGNFRQGLLLAMFGGVDLLVDPFSSAANAQVTLHVNRFFDVAVRQGGALAICTDIE